MSPKKFNSIFSGLVSTASAADKHVSGELKSAATQPFRVWINSDKILLGCDADSRVNPDADCTRQPVSMVLVDSAGWSLLEALDEPQIVALIESKGKDVKSVRAKIVTSRSKLVTYFEFWKSKTKEPESVKISTPDAWED